MNILRHSRYDMLLDIGVMLDCLAIYIFLRVKWFDLVQSIRCLPRSDETPVTK